MVVLLVVPTRVVVGVVGMRVVMMVLVVMRWRGVYLIGIEWRQRGRGVVRIAGHRPAFLLLWVEQSVPIPHTAVAAARLLPQTVSQSSSPSHAHASSSSSIKSCSGFARIRQLDMVEVLERGMAVVLLLWKCKGRATPSSTATSTT